MCMYKVYKYAFRLNLALLMCIWLHCLALFMKPIIYDLYSIADIMLQEDSILNNVRSANETSRCYQLEIAYVQFRD